MNKFVQIEEFILDVVLSEQHRLSCDVTEFPVEDGGSFSDNIRPKPIELTIEGVITNAPLPSMQAAQLAKGIPQIGLPDTVSGGSNTPAVIQYLRSDQAYRYLKYLWERRASVTIRTSLGVFQNMAPLDLDIPRDARTGDAIKFTASFRQIQTVTNDRLKTRVPGFGGKNRRGNKAGDPNVGARTLWKRGIQPGGPVIYDTKYVEMRADKKDPTKTQWWYVKNQPISLAAITFQTSRTDGNLVSSSKYKTNTEVSGFFSKFGKEENRLLTDREVFWLLKDLQRDNAAKRAKQWQAQGGFGSNEDELYRNLRDRKAAEQARSWAAGTNPYDPDILRRPIQDPSKMQRSTMQQQGDGRDPLGGVSTKRDNIPGFGRSPREVIP